MSVSRDRVVAELMVELATHHPYVYSALTRRVRDLLERAHDAGSAASRKREAEWITEREELRHQDTVQDMQLSRLADALQRYGRHKFNCGINAHVEGVGCDCGLDAALAEVP